MAFETSASSAQTPECRCHGHTIIAQTSRTRCRCRCTRTGTWAQRVFLAVLAAMPSVGRLSLLGESRVSRETGTW